MLQVDAQPVEAEAGQGFRRVRIGQRQPGAEGLSIRPPGGQGFVFPHCCLLDFSGFRNQASPFPGRYLPNLCRSVYQLG